MPWDSIVKNNLIYERLAFTEEELESMEFLIEIE